CPRTSVVRSRSRASRGSRACLEPVARAAAGPRVVVLPDQEPGLPVAVMGGTIVSAARAGAVTGLTARRLARPGAHVAAILGAGVQAGGALRGARGARS